MDTSFFQSDLFVWGVLPALIFFSRVLDVSIGTMRLIFVSKGFKFIAPILGFFEVTIWLIAMGQIMQHLNNFMCYIAYGGGFAMGNYVGIVLEERMSIGTVLIRVWPKADAKALIQKLRDNDFAVTTVDVEGMSGQVKMLMSIINRKHAKDYVEIVQGLNPKAFFSIEDVNAVQQGYFKRHRTFSAFDHLHFLRRKGK
ncbi:MAG: DUF2179 domain-containing protein [Bacteroidales bacterium]|nr:DUF2179 domain-containing protein [Bacteroidales bacterium]